MFLESYIKGPGMQSDLDLLSRKGYDSNLIKSLRGLYKKSPKNVRILSSGFVPNFARMDFHARYMQQQAEKANSNEARIRAIKENNVARQKKLYKKYPEMKLTKQFDNQLPVIKITDPKTGTATKFSYGKIQEMIMLVQV